MAAQSSSTPDGLSSTSEPECSIPRERMRRMYKAISARERRRNELKYEQLFQAYQQLSKKHDETERKNQQLQMVISKLKVQVDIMVMNGAARNTNAPLRNGLHVPMNAAQAHASPINHQQSPTHHHRLQSPSTHQTNGGGGVVQDALQSRFAFLSPAHQAIAAHATLQYNPATPNAQKRSSPMVPPLPSASPITIAKRTKVDAPVAYVKPQPETVNLSDDDDESTNQRSARQAPPTNAANQRTATITRPQQPPHQNGHTPTTTTATAATSTSTLNATDTRTRTQPDLVEIGANTQTLPPLGVQQHRTNDDPPKMRLQWSVPAAYNATQIVRFELYFRKTTNDPWKKAKEFVPNERSCDITPQATHLTGRYYLGIKATLSQQRLTPPIAETLVAWDYRPNRNSNAEPIQLE